MKNDIILKNVEFKQSSIDLEKRTFEGYASTWDLDQVGDIIVKGAFTKTIMERLEKGNIKILYNHSELIGKPLEMREDDIGLFVKGYISRIQRGDETLEQMRDGSLNHMSIGFSIVKSDDVNGIRMIRELKLWEFSPVVFPANEAAIITAVKNLLGGVSQSARDALGIKEPETTTPITEPRKGADDPELIQSMADFRDELKKLNRKG